MERMCEVEKDDVKEKTVRPPKLYDLTLSLIHIYVFNHQTNVDINNRIVCFDIKELGKHTMRLLISCLLYTSRCV